MNKISTNFSRQPYDFRNFAQAGKPQGVGMPGKVGSKRGQRSEPNSMSLKIPPLKFN